MKLIYNKKFLGHKNINHPENANRLKYFKEYKETKIEYDEKYLELVHTKDHINKIKDLSAKETPYNADTPLFKDSYETAVYAASASVLAAKSNSFALIRPPGHHAGKDFGGGFCLFNNMAIAVQYLINKGLKVFVIDFDIHFGNGTYDILLGKDNCFYFSTQQKDVFPGVSDNMKNCYSVSLDYGISDEEYIKILEKELIPLLDKFKPDVVGLSAGFDGFYSDFNYLCPGLGFKITEKSLLKIKEISSKYSYFGVLEGGYNSLSILKGVSVFLEK